MYEAWGYAFHRLKLDLKRKRYVYYWWKFRLTIAIPIDLIEFVTQADYFCWKMFHVEFQPAENFPFQLINSPLIDAYCPLIECSRYVSVRRYSDLCAFDRMHCLIWIKFCEARGIYPIAHAVGLWSVCLCISFTTTENVRVWRIVQDGMNRSPRKILRKAVICERSTMFADSSVYVEVMDDSKLSDATLLSTTAS